MTGISRWDRAAARWRPREGEFDGTAQPQSWSHRNPPSSGVGGATPRFLKKEAPTGFEPAHTPDLHAMRHGTVLQCFPDWLRIS